MILSFSIEIGSIKTQTRRLLDLGNGTDFPFLNIGRDSYIVSAVSENGLNLNQDYVYSLQIGKFCSLAHNLSFVTDINHDYLSVTTGASELFNTGPSKLKRKGEIIIQNDVWIGRGVTIMAGVTIGNGAVVAANSVITKDVAPYSIVGGVPAKKIKNRFTPEVIDKLQTIQWWYWSEEKIRQRKKWFSADVEAFAEHFYPEALTQREKAQKALSLARKPIEYLYFMDIDEPYSLWRKVISSFCEKYRDNPDCGLILFIKRDENAEKNCRLVERFVEPIDAQCDVFLYFGEEDEVTAAFAYADVLITNRSSDCVYYSCLADQYGLKRIAGVDIPIF